MKYETCSAEETFSLGRALGEHLRAGDIVLLHGDLGVGKSVLTRGLARGCGIDEPMPSPTFTLMTAYKGRIPFYHFDLYRLEGPDEYFEAGLDEFIGGDGAAAIEWPEQAELAFDQCLEVTIARVPGNDDAREVTICLRGLDARADELCAALEKWGGRHEHPVH